MSTDALVFDHLASMTTPVGLYEHALLDQPRVEHGMCVDDVARALVVTSRVPAPSPAIAALTTIYLDFVVDAIHDDGRMHNRRDANGSWTDEVSTDDHWGRAIWALGTAASSSLDPEVSVPAARAAQRALRATTAWPRAAAYAGLGAALLMGSGHVSGPARHTLARTRLLLPAPQPDIWWPWPEERLTYANAVLPECMIAVGRALDDEQLRASGLMLLHWLLDEQSQGTHLSVTPAGGSVRGNRSPGFDQQPIEVACLAEACRTAYLDTGDTTWLHAIEHCVAWFEGANDTGAEMRDAATGAGFDGLERDGVNLNRGAESTLAWLSTQQVSQLARIGSLA